MKRFWFMILVLGVCTSVVAQTEEETLLILADQTFGQLHEEWVTLPDLTSERIARSMESLPPWWLGGLMGLVKQEFVEEAFLAEGLAGLDAGALINFNKPGEFDLFVFFQRDPSTGIVVASQFQACPEGECYGLGPLGCDEGTITCWCNVPCHDCIDKSGTVYIAVYDGNGNLVHMEEAESGTIHEICDDPPGRKVIISA